EVGAVGDALELAAPEREVILHVRTGRGIVGKLVLVVLAKMEILAAHAERDIPVVTPLAPVSIPVGRLVGAAEELDLHLLELAAAKREIARVDFVAECLAN